MKIFDEQGAELTTAPDLSLGWLEDTTKTIHHDAVKGVKAQFHYRTVRECPNGGKDVERVVDVPGVEARDAYDETVEVQVYHLYTAEELTAQKEAKKKAEEAAAAQAKKKAALEAVPERVDALEAANDDIVLMMADLIGGTNE